MKPYFERDGIAIYLGDCLVVMPELPSGCINMVCADLPYGTTQCGWDAVIPFDALWTNYDRVARRNAAIVLTAQAPFDKVLGASRLEWLRYEWVWEKTAATGHLNAKKMPMKAHENILVFYRELPTYNPIKTQGHVRKVSHSLASRNQGQCYGAQAGVKSYDSTERYPRSVLRFATDKQKSALHPTQKPVALMQYLIETYTNPGELVLDNTCGSGSTLVAASLAGRRAVGIEKEERYCEIAARRLSQGSLFSEASLIFPLQRLN